MRIMIASETYPPSINGAAIFTQRLAAGLAGRGHEAAVVAPSPTGFPYTERVKEGVTIFGVRSVPTTYPGQRCGMITGWGARKLIGAFQPDLLHIQNHFIIGRALARAGRAVGIPIIGTNHFMPENMIPHTPGGLWSGRWSRMIHRVLWRQFVKLYRHLDAVTFPSRAAAMLAQAQGFWGPAHVISNGIDIARFRPGPLLGVGVAQRDESRKPIILYVGRLDPEKGVDTLIRAMASVVSRHPAELLLCGRGVHSAALRSLGEKLGLAGSIRFGGFVPDEDLPSIYQNAAVFVMPSPVELQSIATLEAMASGLPIIAADVMALPELVKEEENGFLFPPGDAEALADQLVTLLSNLAAASRMGEASRDIAERHRIDLTLAAFESLYESLLEKASAHPWKLGAPWHSSSQEWQAAGDTLSRKNP